MAAEKERGPGAASAEISKYLDILAKDPNSRVFAPLAEAYRKAGFFDDAIQTALEGLKVHPNYLGGRVALGRAYFDKKLFAEAAAEMARVVNVAPDNIIAHKVLGRVALGWQDFPKAEKSLKMVLLLDPRDQEAQQLLANIRGGGAPAPAAVSTAAPAFGTPATAARPAAPPPLPSHRPLAPPPPPRVEAPPPPPRPSAPEPPAELEEFVIEDISLEPEFVAEPEPVLPAPEPAVTETSFTEFSFDETPIEPPPEEPLAATAPAPGAAEESSFEVFGRPSRSGTPMSTKGEREAFGEIEIEPAVEAPEQAAPAVEDSPFEVFTRVPWGAGAGAPQLKTGHGEGGAFREIEIETTAHPVPETLAAQTDEVSVVSLDEEIPRIDLSQEVDLTGPGETGDPYAQEIDETAVEVEELPVEPPPVEPAAGRGVFDTETLAAIYTNQGFYSRAVEIYNRLVADRPGDAALRQKLEAVLDLERSQGAVVSVPTLAAPEPVAAAPAVVIAPKPVAAVPELVIAPPAPVTAGAAMETVPGSAREESETIDSLQILLKAFRGGRPR